MLALFSRWLVKLSKLSSRAGLYEFLKREYARIPQKSSVLTIGGDGKVTDLLRAYAKQNEFVIVTMDIAPERGPDVVGDFCDDSCLLGARFDYVILSEVLEHFHNPATAIRNCRRLLKKGGILLITTPFVFPIHERPVDYYRYTKFGLMHLLSEFDDVEIQERNTWVEACLVLPARLYFEKGKMNRIVGAVAIIVSVIAMPLARLVARFCRSDFITTGYNAKARNR